MPAKKARGTRWIRRVRRVRESGRQREIAARRRGPGGVGDRDAADVADELLREARRGARGAADGVRGATVKL